MALRISSLAAVVGLLFGGLAIYSKTLEPAASRESAALDSLSGTYLDNLGGKLHVEVNEAGRLEGFYEHGATFGEVYGRIEDKTLTGFWMENDSPMTCASERHGAATWGRLKWAFTDDSAFVGMFNYYGAEPSTQKPWSGARISAR